MIAAAFFDAGQTTMRYFFHLRHDELLFEDPEGIEFPGLQEARLEAELGARELIAEAFRCGGALRSNESFEIHDESGDLVHTFSFSVLIQEALAG